MDAKGPGAHVPVGTFTSAHRVLGAHGKSRAGLRHYVFRYRGRGPAPDHGHARIADAVQVLDQATRMLLVEGSASQIASLGEALPSWLVKEEHAFALGRGSIGGSDHEVGS